MSITTRISLHTSLRWLRRIMTTILILANFAATLLADAPRGGWTAAALFGSLLICLFLIFFMRMRSGKKPGSILNPALSFIRSGLE